MKKILMYITVLFLLNCSENVKDWADPKDSVPPGKITNVVHTSLPGGVQITYNLPNDEDVLGVKATYTLVNGGEIKEVFSSAYRDTISIFGFPDIKQRQVELYCVDKSNNFSEPVSITFMPLIPPVQTILESFELMATYSGVFASWLNETGADLAILLSTTDSLGEMKLVDTHYTKLKDGAYTFRGFSADPTKFRIQLRDRWGNFSEPLDTIIKPLFEEEIKPRNALNQVIWERIGHADKTTVWRGDLTDTNNNWERITDGTTIGRSTYYESATNYLNTFDPSLPPLTPTLPMYMTLDLKSTVTISRHKLWMRGRNVEEPYLQSGHRYYQQGAPKVYEIWVSENPPKQNSEFASRAESLAYWTKWPAVGGTDAWKNDWILLARCENLPLSGAKTTAELTVDDIIAADEGYEVEISPEFSNTRVRYVRFVFLENWELGRAQMQFKQIKFFGSYVND